MHDVPLSVTLLFAGLLVAMILCLALEEKIHAKKSVILGVFSAITLFLADGLGLVHREIVEIGGHAINLPVYIPGVDWEVIAIILGSSIFVDVTSKSGLFTWIAIKLTKSSRGDPLRLLVYYCCMTVVFSAVLNNVTAIIIVGSLTSVSLAKLGRSEKLLGFLLVEGLLTNIGGLLTLISSVPNIIVGNAAKISFVDFFVAASPYVIVATIVTIWLGARIFSIPRLKTEKEKAEARELVMGFDETDGIESWARFRLGAFMTLAFVGVMASASVLPVISDLGLGYVALAFAALALVQFRSTPEKFYQSIDWDLLAFFGCLFIVINMMEHALVLKLIGDGLRPVLALGEIWGTAVLLVVSAVASSVTDNIPLAAMLAKILGGMGIPSESPFWWAVIFGANLGGNITPIGSASTLVAVTIIHKNKLSMTFGKFVKMAIPFALIQIALAVGYVLVVLA